MRRLLAFYQFAVLKAPRITLLVMSTVLVVCLFQARHFFLDASSDSLMLENDPGLRLFRTISQRYGSLSLLAVTFQPAEGDLFSPENLTTLRELRDAIRALPDVEHVATILDVPLFQNPPAPISQVAENVRTLEDPETDPALAREELLNSEVYKQQLISQDGKTAALATYLKPNPELSALRNQRTNLQLAIDRGEETRKNGQAHQSLTPELRRMQKDNNRKIARAIGDIRAISRRFQSKGELHLGGEALIADDMLTYIRNDLKVFGVAIFVCIAVMLKYFFGSKRWVLLAVACCAYSTVAMVGLLGAFEWPVTVISSNFISLLLIMNMSLVIHLIVQYRELSDLHPDLPEIELIGRTVAHKWVPCLFTTLTTIAGFSSLVLCDIKPVKDFGLMMSLALVLSMVTSFILFPSLLVLFPKERRKKARDVGRPVTALAARCVEKRGGVIVLGTLLIIIFILYGTSRLTVENSFVNHFRKNSDIRKGMVLIDRQLGGTTPLDVIIDLPGSTDAPPPPPAVSAATDDVFDEFSEFSEFETAAHSNAYWFTPAKLETVRKVHRILEQQPEIGKVWSFASLLRLTDRLNGGQPLDAFELAIMAEKLPDYAREILIKPFVSIPDNQFRITCRVYDSDENLRRQAFLKRLENQLNAQLELPPENIRLTGAMVLYNSVLQSLFRSQILTLGVVFVVLLIMFVVLFRSLKLALIALFPNLVSSMTVLGFLGTAGIPLDIMTITIASVSIGIAVDDTIHYIHRFREEFLACGNYHTAMRNSHKGVGSAMYYTSVTIVGGFSLLVFSNFIPSVLFGLLTGGAMIIALFGALTLLPLLLIRLRPFGPEVSGEAPPHRAPARE